jgi:hypothetical protein
LSKKGLPFLTLLGYPFYFAVDCNIGWGNIWAVPNATAVFITIVEGMSGDET